MPKKTRRRWSAEEKARIIERYHASGLSREGFAREEDIGSSVLGNWLRKESRSASSGRGVELIAVEVRDDATKDRAFIEIVVRGDRRIRVCRGFDRQLLEDLIATLERC